MSGMYALVNDEETESKTKQHWNQNGLRRLDRGGEERYAPYASRKCVAANVNNGQIIKRILSNKQLPYK